MNYVACSRRTGSRFHQRRALRLPDCDRARPMLPNPRLRQTGALTWNGSGTIVGKLIRRWARSRVTSPVSDKPRPLTIVAGELLRRPVRCSRRCNMGPFETDRLILRPFEATDVPVLRELIYSDRESGASTAVTVTSQPCLKRRSRIMSISPTMRSSGSRWWS